MAFTKQTIKYQHLNVVSLHSTEISISDNNEGSCISMIP